MCVQSPKYCLGVDQTIQFWFVIAMPLIRKTIEFFSETPTELNNLANLSNLLSISTNHSQSKKPKCTDHKWSPIIILTMVLDT